MATDFTKLSLTDITAQFEAMGPDAQVTFGSLDAQQLNWRPNAASWSVAQCFDHLLKTNHEMLVVLDAAMSGAAPRSVWQRLPLLARIFGPIMVKSQMPEATRKFTAPPIARPAVSAIDPDVIASFIRSQNELAAHVRPLDERKAASTIAVSPFASFITYSVLDGYRLVVTHQRRHFEQARRVTMASGFPSSEGHLGV